MSAHHTNTRPLGIANARHSPGYVCALRLDRTPFGALLGHARNPLRLWPDAGHWRMAVQAVPLRQEDRPAGSGWPSIPKPIVDYLASRRLARRFTEPLSVRNRILHHASRPLQRHDGRTTGMAYFDTMMPTATRQRRDGIEHRHPTGAPVATWQGHQDIMIKPQPSHSTLPAG